MLLYTMLRHTSLLAVMPVTHFSRSVFIALASISMLSKRQWMMMGSMTFSSS